MEVFEMWEETDIGEISSVTFPLLDELEIMDCPKLTAFPHVPVLKTLTLIGNRTLIDRVPSLTTLSTLTLSARDASSELLMTAMAGADGHGSVAASIPCVTLNTGHAMPVMGFGTGSSRKPDDLPATILHAVRLGYRHLDTASLYGTEGAVGAAVADAVRSGAVASRADLFVTSKLWITDARADRVVPALRESLGRLGLDYLDLFLVHWPVAADGNKNILPFDMEGVWRGMEECHRLGLARSIGVSNFSQAKMSRLLALAAVLPAVNQVELNVGWRQEKVREVCANNGVVVTAFSPLGAHGSEWGSNAVMESGVLRDIAAMRGKTVAQVALRWLHEQGVGFVARSFNKERMKQNMEIFDWELSEDDKEKIMQIPQRRACQGEFFVSPNGPYKSLEELWDGEI